MHIGYLARPAEVIVRFAIVVADNPATATRWRPSPSGQAAFGSVVVGPGEVTLAECVHGMLLDRRSTVAAAESLTGGLVGAALTDVSGASSTFRGGVVAYATALKSALLGVDDAMLARFGAVHPDVARAMAREVRVRLGATYGVATTGVAGPDPQDGKPVGTMHIAVAGPEGPAAVESPVATARDRETLRRIAVVHALDLLRRSLGPA